jgi:hypothetical protein
MFNPAYLILSRRNIYYFRWPLPKAFSRPNQRIHLKLFHLENTPMNSR